MNNTFRSGGSDTTEGAAGKDSIQRRVDQLDITLFEGIPSETGADDRRSLLALHAATAARRSKFAYLEIGSHLGGSIQPYLLDSRCNAIISIDKRPSRQPDLRGKECEYSGNSTERMLQNLRSISADAVGKVTTFDADTSQLKSSVIPLKPAICLIDGEHTNLAVERDFAFCLSVVEDRGVICFHDSHIIFEALSKSVEHLRASGRPFRAYNLPIDIFVIDLGASLHEDTRILELLVDNHLGYLAGLKAMSGYRDFYNSWFSQKLRGIYRMPPVRECSRLIRRFFGG